MTGLVEPPPGFTGVFRTDDAARGVYAEAAGIGRMMPRAVAVARSVHDVCAVVKWARATGVPITPRGSGSSMANGAIGPGVVLDVSPLAVIDGVDTSARTVRCGAGAVRDAVDRVARFHGLRLPVDPSSGAFCTVGGMVATNAAGAHSLKYGSIRRWVRAVECVLADGAIVTLRRGDPLPDNALLAHAKEVVERRAEAATPPRVRKNSSGYAIAVAAESGDLLDVIVGSEGTLAIVTAVELSLDPVPGATSTILATFDDIGDAARAAAAATRLGAVACELLERTFLEIAARGGNLDAIAANTGAALLVEVEGDDSEAIERAAAAMRAALESAGARATTVALERTGELEIWQIRHAASPILAELEAELRSVQVIEDGAVPPEHLTAYVAGVRAALDEARMRGVIFGHAGDAHVHVNPLVGFGDSDWRDRLESLLEATTDLTARLGGTLSGEHGDGRLRAPLLARTWLPEALAAFAELKRGFDPENVLNPGVKVALAGQKPIESVKYDGALDPLPAPARAALAHVAAKRAYAEPRLPLLERLT